jgi:hypothetical protein
MEITGINEARWLTVSKMANAQLQAVIQRVIDMLTRQDPDVATAVVALQAVDAGFDAIRDGLNAAGTILTP